MNEPALIGFLNNKFKLLFRWEVFMSVLRNAHLSTKQLHLKVGQLMYEYCWVGCNKTVVIISILLEISFLLTTKSELCKQILHIACYFWNKV